MEEALRLARQLAAFDDPMLRARRAAELLRAVAPEEAVRTLGALVRLADQRKSPLSTALEGVLRALRDVLDEAARTQLRATADALAEADVLALLSQAQAARSFDRDEEPWVDREMRALSLGHRKQLARGMNRDRLARLLTDPDAAVLKNLLDNPRITEREVLAAASRRPVRTEVLEEIFRSRRWASNRSIRRALALNPYSPPALATAALALLTLPDLREVVRDQRLSPEVLSQARRLIAHRTGLAQGVEPNALAPATAPPREAGSGQPGARDQPSARSDTLEERALALRRAWSNRLPDDPAD